MTKKYFTDESLATLVDETKAYVDEVASGKANSSHNHAASNITSGTLSSDRLPTVPITKGGTGATTAAAALTNLGLTATAAELNYVDGVTSNIQSQLDGKAASSHSHTITASATDDDVIVLTGTNGSNKVTYDAKHANSGVTAGTYKSVTVNAKGHVTAGTNPTTLSGYGITDAYTKTQVDSALSGKAASSHTHDYLPLSGGTITGSIDTDDAYMHNLGSDANPFGVIYSGMFKGNLTGLADSATTAIKLATDAGSATQPVYFSDGVPVACTYTLGKSVPSDAKFTDTTYTLSSFGITATAAELNYCDGVTSNIQTQLNGKAASSHTHSYLPLSGGTITGALTVNSTFATKAGVEVYGATPYIDFHFGNSTDDYTSRIIESASGTISINGVKFASDHVYVPNNSSYRTYTSSGTAIGILYVSDDNNLSLGHYASSSHTGNTYVNSYSGTVHLRNKTTSLDFTNTSGTNYAGAFMPGSNGEMLLGGASHRWYKMYAATACNTSSDEREKSDIMSIADYPIMYSRDGEGNILEQLFDKLVPATYTLNIENTNEMHIGFVAQDISKSMEELGLTEEDLGLIDHSYWTDEETGEEKDRYSLAYEEFIALNTYMIQKQKAKIQTLEERIAQLEELVSVS